MDRTVNLGDSYILESKGSNMPHMEEEYKTIYPDMIQTSSSSLRDFYEAIKTFCPTLA
jgi:hypothetical protein